MALGLCKSAFVGIGAFSGLINLLMLTSSLFMLEVYDRVLRIMLCSRWVTMLQLNRPNQQQQM